jgi:hypothetical protein
MTQDCPPGYEPIPLGWGELPAIDEDEVDEETSDEVHGTDAQPG